MAYVTPPRPPSSLPQGHTRQIPALPLHKHPHTHNHTHAHHCARPRWARGCGRSTRCPCRLRRRHARPPRRGARCSRAPPGCGSCSLRRRSCGGAPRSAAARRLEVASTGQGWWVKRALQERWRWFPSHENTHPAALTGVAEEGTVVCQLLINRLARQPAPAPLGERQRRAQLVVALHELLHAAVGLRGRVCVFARGKGLFRGGGPGAALQDSSPPRTHARMHARTHRHKRVAHARACAHAQAHTTRTQHARTHARARATHPLAGLVRVAAARGVGLQPHDGLQLWAGQLLDSSIKGLERMGACWGLPGRQAGKRVVERGRGAGSGAARAAAAPPHRRPPPKLALCCPCPPLVQPHPPTPSPPTHPHSCRPRGSACCPSRAWWGPWCSSAASDP